MSAVCGTAGDVSGVRYGDVSGVRCQRCATARGVLERRPSIVLLPRTWPTETDTLDLRAWGYTDPFEKPVALE